MLTADGLLTARGSKRAGTEEAPPLLLPNSWFFLPVFLLHPGQHQELVFLIP